MDFEFNEEQRLMADSVERFLSERYDFDQRRKIIQSDTCASDEIWQQLAEMGVFSISLSEAAGGFGGVAVDLINTMQSIGKALAVEPVLPTLQTARLIDRVGSDAQKAEILSGVIDGSVKLAFAHTEEEARYELASVETRALRDGDGWVLSGLKCSIAGAPLARWLVVSARTSGKPSGVSLFLVPTDTKGLSMTSYNSFDSQRGAHVLLNSVRVGPQALLGVEGEALPAIEEAADFTTALLCAEALGAVSFATDTTLEYLKTRKQFGVTIGSFQALQHRMVDMYVNVEQVRSMAYLACSKVDVASDARERARVVAAAKLKISDVARQIGQEAIQLHGGIGMTTELKVSHTFRRLTMIAQQFGDSDYCLERFAALDR